MRTYLVSLGGRCSYQVEASSVPTAVVRGIKDYLTGIDLTPEEGFSEEQKARSIKARKKYMGRLNDPNRQDEGSYNLHVWVKRIA